MKTIATVILILLINSLTGQSKNTVEYRLVAFKKNNNAIISVSNEVEVIKRLHIEVPNAFSPDGDGINDLFGAISEGVEDYDLNIYNRWGEIVYHSNDINESWDGSFKGTKAMQDAYVYVIEARGADDDNYTKLKGTVSLIR